MLIRDPQDEVIIAKILHEISPLGGATQLDDPAAVSNFEVFDDPSYNGKLMKVSIRLKIGKI